MPSLPRAAQIDAAVAAAATPAALGAEAAEAETRAAAARARAARAEAADAVRIAHARAALQAAERVVDAGAQAAGAEHVRRRAAPFIAPSRPAVATFLRSSSRLFASTCGAPFFEGSASFFFASFLPNLPSSSFGFAPSLMPESFVTFLISFFFSALISIFTYLDGLAKMSSALPPSPSGVSSIAATRAMNAIRQIEVILKKVKSASSSVLMRDRGRRAHVAHDEGHVGEAILRPIVQAQLERVGAHPAVGGVQLALALAAAPSSCGCRRGW